MTRFAYLRTVALLSSLWMHPSVASISLDEDPPGSMAATWTASSGAVLDIGAPEIIIKDWIQGKNQTTPLEINLEEKTMDGHSAEFLYSVFLDKTNYGIAGSYRLSLSYDQEAEHLRYETELVFDSPVRTDVNVRNNFTLRDHAATEILLPEREGVVRTFPLQRGAQAAGRYELGAGSTSGVLPDSEDYLRRFDLPQSKWFPGNGEGLIPGFGVELGIPVIGLSLDEETKLAVSIDPYCGGMIQAEPATNSTLITVSTLYQGTVVPLQSESRDVGLTLLEQSGEFDSPDSVDSVIMSFYKMVPYIKPGPAWLHDVHLTYYDYLSDGGEGWFDGLKHLAEQIPEAYRGRVAVTIHGWYDYFLRYAYDYQKDELVDEWVAFPGTRKIKMSIESMRNRMRFAQKLGFRTVLYFADGTNSDSGNPNFSPEFLFRDVHGNTSGGWVGPDSVGRPVRSDPSAPGLRDWLKSYLRALLDEYGELLDALVWDETFYIDPNTISYGQENPKYADREMLSLVSELTQIVQEYQKENPDLAFLVSDWGHNSNGLVAHGTYEDTTLHPDRWHRSMFSNYRNSIWSNSWRSVSHVYHSYLASVLGFPQSISNGWKDDLGPHEMPPEILNGMLERFIESAESDKHRPLYFKPDGEPVYIRK